jgi:hypothetical protein
LDEAELAGIKLVYDMLLVKRSVGRTFISASFWESALFQFGVFVFHGAAAGGSRYHRTRSSPDEAEDFVVALRVNAFQRTR